ncbi:hypothetical protein BJV82DRAFT_490996, partial [Fennellomyces sp. T-0311]
MDVDAAQTKKFAPLTKEEKDRRRKLGLCLYCGEAGHEAQSCPKKLKGKTQSSREPLQLPVILHLENSNLQVHAMIDSGAMESFIDTDYAHQHNVPLRESKQPLQVFTVDGRSVRSGLVTQECAVRMSVSN